MRVTGTADKFIGTLNVDDFATFQVNVMQTGGAQQGTGATIPVSITFKDSTNQEHTITQDVPVTPGATSGTGAAGANFRGRSSGLFGLGDIPLYAGVLILLVLAYFGYKRHKAGLPIIPDSIKIPFVGTQIKLPPFGKKKK